MDKYNKGKSKAMIFVEEVTHFNLKHVGAKLIFRK